MRDDPELDIIRKRGFEHEKRYLADLGRRRPDGRSRSRRTARSRTAATSSRAAAAATIEAMASGADVIYQATFFDGTWRGHADFLLSASTTRSVHRVWGPWHYEVADTKLARHVKASAVLQICSYVDQLERDPGRPARVDARRARRQRPRRSSGCASTTTWPTTAARRALPRDRRRTAAARSRRGRPIPSRSTTATSAAGPRDAPPGAAPTTTSPSWRGSAAGSGRRSMAAGSTRSRLSATCPCRSARLEGTGAAAHRARRASRRGSSSRAGPWRPSRCTSCCCPSRASRSIPSAASRRCRRPSPGDLFFDIEGDPFAPDDGLDYLFGVLEHGRRRSTRSGRATTTGEFTAGRRAGRRSSGSWTSSPSGCSGTRPARLPLRAVRADRAEAADGPPRDARGRGRRACCAAASSSTSYRAVRQSLRASVESYSIKQHGAALRLRARDRAARRRLEHRRVRAVARARRGRAAGGRRSSSGSSATTATTCVSNLRLRDWLERLRVELAAADRPGVRGPRPRAELPRRRRRAHRGRRRACDALADRLTVRRAGRSRTRRAAGADGCSPSSSAGTAARRRSRAGSSIDRMGLDAADLVDDRCDRPAEPLGPVDGAAKGKQVVGISRSPTAGIRPRRPAATLYDPALYREQPDAKCSGWRSPATLVARRRRAALTRRHRARTPGRRTPSAHPAEHLQTTRSSGPRCSSSARGSPTTASTPTVPHGARPATSSCGGRHALARRPGAGPRAGRADAGRGAAARPRRSTGRARDPGAARLRQDLHAARG